MMQSALSDSYKHFLADAGQNRQAAPAIFAIGWKKKRPEKEKEPVEQSDFEDHLERELKPFGSLDTRLTETERRQLDELERIRDALRKDTK